MQWFVEQHQLKTSRHTRLAIKKLANYNEQENAKSLCFWAFGDKKANFGQFIAKTVKTFVPPFREFCKVTEKSN